MCIYIYIYIYNIYIYIYIYIYKFLLNQHIFEQNTYFDFCHVFRISVACKMGQKDFDISDKCG